MLSDGEAFPLAPLKAAACGVPVISYPDCGGIHDWLWTDHDGWVCEERDPTSIAHTIVRLMADPARWAYLRYSAIELASDFFTEACFRRTMDFYRAAFEGHN